MLNEWEDRPSPRQPPNLRVEKLLAVISVAILIAIFAPLVIHIIGW